MQGKATHSHQDINPVTFSTSFVPEIRFGNDLHRTIGAAAAGLGGIKSAALVIDGFLARSGLADTIVASLAENGIGAKVFSDFAGEPKLAHVRAAIEAVKGADLVIGVGGGSAL